METVLARKLHVSRGPLREALKALEGMHLVESRRGRGTYVREVTPDELAQLISVQAVLEGVAARFAASNATPQVIEALQLLCRRIDAAARAGRHDVWRDLDWSFHELVCTFSGSAILLASWRAVANLARVHLHRQRESLANLRNVRGIHSALAGAITERDPGKAEALFRATILKLGFAGLGRDVPESLKAYVEPVLPAGSARERMRGARRAGAGRRPGRDPT